MCQRRRPGCWWIRAAGRGGPWRPALRRRQAPRADIAIDVAHIVVQQDIGRSGRHGAKSGADDGGNGKVSLDQRVFEVVVKEVRDRHGPEADHFGHLAFGHLAHLATQPQQFQQIAGAEGGGVGRRAHQHGADKAAKAQDVAGVAVIRLGIAGGVAGEFAAVGVVVAEHAKIAAVVGKDRAALIGQDLQPVARQFQIAHDFGAEQRRDVGAVGISEAGV